MNEVKHHTSVPTAIPTQVDYILLDGSGSMQGDIWWTTCDAIDTFVHEVDAKNINSQIILATFDSTDMHCIQRDQNIRDWQPLARDPIGAHWTTTPLYDAIAECGRRLRDLDPPRASIVIATDGDENASRYTDLARAVAILKWMEAKGWSVTFIGCDWNNSKLASKLGLKPAQAIGVGRRHLADAAKALASKRAHYGATGEPMHFSDDERNQFGGYLPG